MKTEPFQRPDCADFLNEKHSEIVVTDGGRNSTQLRYENISLSSITKYRVDGCLLQEEIGKRKCDYILLNIDILKAYFIELKGSDLDSAVKQIDTALDILYPTLKPHNFVPHGQIILTKVNTIDRKNLNYLRLEKKFQKEHGTLEKTSQRKVITE